MQAIIKGGAGEGAGAPKDFELGRRLEARPGGG
jgi:hypothetical protein